MKLLRKAGAASSVADEDHDDDAKSSSSDKPWDDASSANGSPHFECRSDDEDDV